MLSPTPSARTVRRIAVLVAVAATGPARGAAQQSAVPVPAAQSFTINLGSGAVAGVLPFDVPFTLAGPAGESLQRVVLYYAPAATFPDTACVRNAPKAGPGRPDSAMWKQTGAGIPADSFRLSVGPLRANETYTFCLHLRRAPGKEALARFRDEATDGLFQTAGDFVATNPKGFSDDSIVRAAQQALVAALPPTGPGTSRVVPPTSLLSDAAPLDTIKRQLAPLTGPTRNAAVQRAQFDSAADSVSARIYALGQRSRAVLGRISAARWPGLSRAEFGERRALTRLAADLANTDARATIAAALGAAVLDPARPLNAIDSTPARDTAAMLQRVRNLDSTAALLGTLRVLVDQLARSADLRKDAGFGAADVGALETLRDALDEVRDDFASQSAIAELLRRQLVAASAQARRIANTVSTVELPRVVLAGTTSADYTTRARWYVSADLGFLYGPRLARTVVPYAGANFYFAPVNKQMPVRYCPWGTAECLRKRASFTLGTTLSSVSQDDRKDLFGDLFGSSSLLAGVGVRLTDFLRLSGGALVHRRVTERGADGSASRTKVTAAPAYALSVDFELRDVLGAFGSVFK